MHTYVSFFQAIPFVEDKKKTNLFKRRNKSNAPSRSDVISVIASNANERIRRRQLAVAVDLLDKCARAQSGIIGADVSTHCTGKGLHVRFRDRFGVRSAAKFRCLAS
jgi:hypothetical protein